MPSRQWKPRTKSEEHMLPKYRTWKIEDRYAEGVRLATDPQVNMSQSEAARQVGVARARLNQKIKAAERPPVVAQHVEGPVVPTRLPADVASGPLDPFLVELERFRAGDGPFPDFKLFVRYYFGHVVCPNCERHHDVPEVHDALMDELQDPEKKRLLVNIAPYHAKSTIATFYHSVYEICKNVDIRIAIVCKTDRLAKRFVKQIQDALMNENMYAPGRSVIDDFGPFYNPNRWAANEFWVSGNSGKEKDPTVSAYGAGAQIYGYRFDIMKFDDIADLENMRNAERVKEMLLWSTQECGSRVGSRGKLQFVGTRISAGDIYSELDKLPGFAVVRFPCITDEDAKTTVWQDHFNWEDADLQRRSMPSAEQFQLVYQNVDTPGLGASFTQEMLDRSHDFDRHLGEYDPSWALVCGLDPAGANAQAGFTALILLGIDLDTGVRNLVDLVNVKQMKAPQVKDQIVAWADTYPLRELRVEVNGLQSQIYQYDNELNEKLTNRGVRIVPHITHKNKWDPQFGVEAMASLFHNQMLTIPWASVEDRRKVRELEKQLIQFPMGEVTDLVMALWFAELSCKEIHQRTRIPAFDTRRNVPARIQRGRRLVDFSAREARAPTREDMVGDGPFSRPAGRTVKLTNMAGEVSLP